MKKIVLLAGLWLSTLVTIVSCLDSTASGQQPTQTVAEKMAKARAAKAQKKEDRATSRPDPNTDKSLKATPADYQAPVDKVLKGPNGEAVHTGDRGGKFYINKNGNKTYLSSNQ